MICSVDGCHLPLRAKGMCKNHRQRFLKYGRLDKILTGDKTKHPLYGMWNKRRQLNNSFVLEWLDFSTFIKAVGNKPDDHFLARLDETKPCGPDNFEWRKIKVKKLPGETARLYKLRQLAAYRAENPLNARRYNYKYSFDITIEQYEEKLKAQNYVCEICGEPEKVKYKRTKIVRNLAVDHNHKTNQMRDLLCTGCNLLVGKIEDNRSILAKIEKYLDKWQVQQETL